MFAYPAVSDDISIEAVVGFVVVPTKYPSLSVASQYSFVYPFAFQLAGVVVNTEHTREAITKDQMRKFLKFVHDDNVYCKYYEVFYILFHTGL